MLRGNLYVPLELDEPAAAVPILGPYCFVKEQAPVQYATRLADEGFVALAFDAATHGASGGQPRRREDPLAKVADVRTAMDYLQTRPEVDAARLSVLGVCEGASEMLRVGFDDARATAVAAISGHYRDADNDVDLAGGEALAAGAIDRAEVHDRLEARRERGASAQARYARTGEVEYGAIVDPERTDVALPWRMI